MPSDDRPLNFRQHGVVEAEDAGEAHLATSDPIDQVGTEFLLDGAVLVSARAQAGKVMNVRVGIHPSTLLPGSLARTARN